jgi:S1-C subfamily serine protease
MSIMEQFSDEIAQAVAGILPSVVEIRGWWPGPRRFGVLRGVESESPAGAGVIIKPDGVIITNRHVVYGANRLHVLLQDQRGYEPEICGVDPISDIAVLRIPVDDLPVAPLGAHRTIRLGEIVLAVGHPLGFTSTITMGIVSAPARVCMDPSGRQASVFIQTDAAINPGNSGGALVGCDGKVLGITTWGIAGGENLAFAIPIETALGVATTLLQDGRIEYGTIGVEGVEANLPAKVVSSHRLQQSTALLVLRADRLDPAAKGGIEPGDWIIAIGDRKIDSLQSFWWTLQGALIDKPVTLKVVRGRDYSLAHKQVTVARLRSSES